MKALKKEPRNPIKNGTKIQSAVDRLKTGIEGFD